MKTPNDPSSIDDSYCEAIAKFHDWCERHRINFRVEMIRMIGQRIGGDVDVPAAFSVQQEAKQLAAREKRRAYCLANRERIAKYMREYQRRKRAEALQISGDLS